MSMEQSRDREDGQRSLLQKARDAAKNKRISMESGVRTGRPRASPAGSVVDGEDLEERQSILSAPVSAASSQRSRRSILNEFASVKSETAYTGRSHYSESNADQDLNKENVVPNGLQNDKHAILQNLINFAEKIADFSRISAEIL